MVFFRSCISAEEGQRTASRDSTLRLMTLSTGYGGRTGSGAHDGHRENQAPTQVKPTGRCLRWEPRAAGRTAPVALASLPGASRGRSRRRDPAPWRAESPPLAPRPFPQPPRRPFHTRPRGAAEAPYLSIWRGDGASARSRKRRSCAPGDVLCAAATSGRGRRGELRIEEKSLNIRAMTKASHDAPKAPRSRPGP
jgi:hypothetical protein